MDQDRNDGGDPLREVQDTAARVARDAAGSRDENERAMHGGQETDYAFRLPPDMAEADRIRAADDVDLADRQAQIARTQQQAAEALSASAEGLGTSGQALSRAAEAVRDNRGDLGDIQANAREIREQMERTREQVSAARVPRVGGGDEGGDGNDGQDQGGR